jgi:hypothetical protein
VVIISRTEFGFYLFILIFDLDVGWVECSETQQIRSLLFQSRLNISHQPSPDMLGFLRQPNLPEVLPLDEDYPDAPMIKLVCDNLNTHHIGSLYHAFPAETAHRLARRLSIHYTPRNGSWLNIAETELSVLSQQCLDRRISRADLLKSELAAWQQERNREHAMAIYYCRCSN